MSDRAQWLFDFDASATSVDVDGLVPVNGYTPHGRPPEEVAMMEKAAAYRAHAVFFEAGRNGGPPVAQAFVFVSDGPADDPQFAEMHQRLWSWGCVPLVYRKTPGLVQLFRCAHKPDFVSATGERVCKPFKTLKTAGAISDDPWWDSARLRNGTLWDDPAVCKMMLSASKSAHKRLIDAVRQLNADLNEEGILKKHLRRKLLILSLLIAYLEERGVLLPDYFGQFHKGASKFFEILARGDALVKLLGALEERFNGNVFTLETADRRSLRGNSQLARFARLIEGREELDGQLTLWQLYSFKDLPVELISHIYQLFVNDSNTSVYTPPFLVRLMLDEALSWKRLDRLQQKNEIILDPACGSGVFLVEAYKRLVLHWRSRNGWKQPTITVLKGLLKKVHGVDLEEGAVELAAFSLCLALCDALEPETIRASIKLFPLLAGKTLHHCCFFQAKEDGLIKEPIGLVTGNPPFTSSLGTPGAERSYRRYESTHGSLPDKQLAYLFLHEAMEMVAEGGAISMLQQYNFLYNQQSLAFRRDFIGKWDVREILDFVSVRGLFHKGGADTKVIVVLSEAVKPPADRRILHATFRRSGRVDAEQGFDIDYYDLHWLPRQLVLENDGVWRSDLLGGGRVLGFVDRLRQFRTLEQFAESRGWDYGEGYIAGGQNISRPAGHIIGKPLLPSDALTSEGIDVAAITIAPKQPIEGPRSERRFTPPMLLVRENMNLPHDVWEKHYLTFKAQLVGFAAPPEDLQSIRNAGAWLSETKRPLQAYVAAISTSLFSRRATAVCADEILALPYPESASLDLSANEQILVDDITDYYRDLIRLGEDSQAMKESGLPALTAFAATFTRQINAIYKQNPLRTLKPYAWPGAMCLPFVFGDGKVDWNGAEELKGKLDSLLYEQRNTTLHVTRIARIYDVSFIFLLKPEPVRYWLRSTALRDADETLSDLRAQGF
ncbi:MAG TPA: N-6 DNA methylase [Bryobacteraceae bacterium]|nr:N-6 DNA methylase [Bryobacteraceae bacterium]